MGRFAGEIEASPLNSEITTTMKLFIKLANSAPAARKYSMKRPASVPNTSDRFEFLFLCNKNLGSEFTYDIKFTFLLQVKTLW